MFLGASGIAGEGVRGLPCWLPAAPDVRFPCGFGRDRSIDDDDPEDDVDPGPARPMIPVKTGIAGAAAIPSADPLLKLRTVSGDVRPPEEMPRPPRPSEDDAPSDMAREGGREAGSDTELTGTSYG